MASCCFDICMYYMLRLCLVGGACYPAFATPTSMRNLDLLSSIIHKAWQGSLLAVSRMSHCRLRGAHKLLVMDMGMVQYYTLLNLSLYTTEVK